jgi:hypothetical protein
VSTTEISSRSFTLAPDAPQAVSYRAAEVALAKS